VKIWISKNSEVPVSEQLVAQLTLGIAANDFKVGERMPSTQEIARRCGIHANTVGAVYRKLTDQDLLEFRPGSGFYVAESAGRLIEGSRRLDELIDNFFEAAASLGFDREGAIKRIKRPSSSRPTDGIVVIESNDGLRDILIHEISDGSISVSGASLEELAAGHLKKTSLFAAMFDEKPKIEPILSEGQRCIYLKGRSVSAAMSGETRPNPGDLIAVVSGWEGFLTFARIMLLAAKIDPGNLIVRSTTEGDWEKAIRTSSLVICDSLTAESLDGHDHVRPFRIIADESINEIQTSIRNSSAS